MKAIDLLWEVGRKTANGHTGLLLYCSKQAVIRVEDLQPLASLCHTGNVFLESGAGLQL